MAKKKNGKKFKFRKFLFIESFKQIDARYIISALYILGAVLLMRLISTGFSQIGLNMLTNVNDSAAISPSASLILLALAVYLLGIIIFSAAAVGLWSAILKKKYDFKVMLKLSVVNFVWASVILLVAYLISGSVDFSSYAVLFILGLCLLIALHIMKTFDYFIVKEGRFIAALKGLFNTGIKKFHKFLLPNLAMIVLFLVLSMIVYPFQFVSDIAYNLVAAILLLFFIIWANFYYALILDSASSKAPKKIKKKK